MGRKPLGFEVLYQEDVTEDYPDFPFFATVGFGLLLECETSFVVFVDSKSRFFSFCKNHLHFKGLIPLLRTRRSLDFHLDVASRSFIVAFLSLFESIA